MTTVVFVHGTGVRQPHYGRTLTRIADGLSDVDPPVSLRACYWGGEHGARLGRDGACIPEPTTTRGPDDEGDIELWALLESDPFYELRLLAAEYATGGELPPDAQLSAHLADGSALVLLDDSDLLAAAQAADLADTFDDAVLAVLAAGPTQEAIANPFAHPDEVTTAIANAIVAEAMRRADDADGGIRAVHGDARDAVVAHITRRLHPDSRGLFGRLAKAGVHLALELGATSKIERKRAVLTRAATPMAGDILLYLARGAAIRAFIAKEIAAVTDDVVIIAHSLGGVACVDLLVEQPMPSVRALITVGSQAPLLYELDALPGLSPGAALPDTFPTPWVNVYDVRDLLSFLAAPIFGERVRDYPVNGRAPFPRSHSAYFSDPAFYAIVRSVVQAVR